MIEELKLQNFQSHKESILEFSNGVNVIIGATDSGKSSIIRALRWLIWNRPSGDAFRSTWGGNTVVELTVNGLKVRRIKMKKDINLYQKDGAKYAAFGTEVPNDIVELLNLDEINLHQQLSGPFLLNTSPGDVARHFNRIAHLDQIDDGLKNIQHQIRKIELEIQVGEKQIEEAEEGLKKFEHLEMFEIDIEVLEDMQTRFLQKVNNARALNVTIEEIDKNQVDIDNHSEILKLEPLLNIIFGWMTERKYTEESYEQLGALKEELEQLGQDVEDHKYIVGGEKPVDDLLALFENRTTSKKKQKTLGMVINSLSLAKENQSELQDQLEQKQELFDDMFPDICPLCDQPIKKK